MSTLKEPLHPLKTARYLWLGILLCTLRFFKGAPAAGWVMVPYLIWVAFAGYRNAGVWVLNAG